MITGLNFQMSCLVALALETKNCHTPFLQFGLAYMETEDQCVIKSKSTRLQCVCALTYISVSLVLHLNFNFLIPNLNPF